jgi:hypothetical protein
MSLKHGKTFILCCGKQKYIEIGGKVLRQLGHKQLFSFHFSSVMSPGIFCIHTSNINYPQ